MCARMESRRVLAFLSITVSLGLAACDGNSSSVAPEMEDDAVLAGMEATIQDEFRAEVENAEIYDRYLDLPLPADVRTVFENNRDASIERHLPAFERCS